MKQKLKVRLYNTKVLSVLTYASVPLNICSVTQIKRLQVIQNDALRWITNSYYPVRCNIEEQHRVLKIEPIKYRIDTLAQIVWFKIEEENSFF